MRSVKVKQEEAQNRLADLWMDYIQVINQKPESHRPLWIAYKIEQKVIHLLAMVRDSDSNAIECLYDAETAMNIRLFESNDEWYMDTMIFEEVTRALPTAHYRVIFGEEYLEHNS